ncbi:HlyD family type I secretion periplasmic adaptor subunit [Novosphingobium flavum]|uniref:Membrane fusion protein (MFP) family protein n=1 Tax=Novosphingobium flavum TaxID=1778672 RepID=A0A7X1FTU2_9SPHN|nr:HlyD family type I secretion periplasmic adaptor subunit [Novosphingobium flavum]MBC2666875.1 HlyD family type I secretion periplasmic adaptor subunit [Novosphingobium flavum]
MTGIALGAASSPATAAPADPAAAFARSLRRARWMLGLTFAGLIAPLAVIPVSGAVIAPGEVAVAGQVKKIAHPRGGVIAAIPVSNGTRVSAGQVLMRLDSNVSAAGAAMTAESIDQLLARQARLRAERDGLGTITFPAELAARAAQPQVAAIMAGERRLFTLGRAALAGQRAALAAQIEQAGKAAGSYRVQGGVYRQQAALIAEERAANDKLWEKRFTTLQRRNELARAAVGLNGNAAAAEAQAASQVSRAAELREQMFVLDQDARRQAGTDLALVEQKLLDQRQANITAQDANERNLIRAPYGGVVDKLAFTTLGGVVPAGETILEIVPDRDPLVIAARISPADIDEVTAGQDVTVRFSAFRAGTTPEIKGRLTRIAADRTVDPQRGAVYYTAEISLAPQDLAPLGPLRLRAGMPAESFIRTGSRSLLSYLFKPLADQFARAFR